uniref:stizolobate synthase n=1 Tax=Bougainvillea glabra TaxID=3541 RepID=A0A286RTK7_9CARY|nr:DOPA 4,5-dioxygenase [Bougainvillea glabra]
MGGEKKMKGTYYLAHGDPIMYINKSIKLRHFLEGWKENVLTEKPKCILVISAHWDTDVPTVNLVEQCDTIHDFDDYPDPLYQIKYPAPGAPKLAMKVQELLKGGGFKCEVDTKRGLDHAVWFPLMFMYPEADIPICELSIQTSKDGTHHYNVGKALSPLLNDDVLIIASGGAVHPSDDTPHFPNGVAPWALEFDNWLEGALLSGRYEDVKEFKKLAPNWEISHPGQEHLYPLHVALGAAGNNVKTELIHQTWAANGVFGYSSYKFTST